MEPASVIPSVILYCPDRHLSYDGATAERVGVGGGVTARLRLAHALAGQGCRVTVVANVPRREVYRKVSFVPLSEIAEARRLEADVLILNSTGGDLDLSPVLELDPKVRLRMVWIGGEARVRGLEAVGYDFLVAPSNYVRRVAAGWGVLPERCLVIPNGVPERRRIWWPVWSRRRDPFRMVYTGHPMKGLDAAVELLRLLRREDPRFTLHVYGGRRLWGQTDEPAGGFPGGPPEGVVWHGLVGQDALAVALRKAGFSINLQGLADGFGIAMAEAMGAGCVVVASAIGAYPELIRHGHDGFLVEGPHDAPETLSRTARLILDLTAEPGLTATIRRNAEAAPLPWSVVAQMWMGHWR